MASKYPSPPASPHSLDDLLTCPVCLDSYKDPRTLSCLHSFCTTCLENCRRPYRRDIVCPVCKKVTPLTPLGICGLQNDFRIQQIRDIMLSQSSPVASDDESSLPVPESPPAGKTCDLCRSENKTTEASTHCIQCFMYFCEPCTNKHNANTLFQEHHVIQIGENSRASEVLFCRSHKEHPVRYFCKPCSTMLCTICTMNHDASHAPEPLDKGIIEKYRKELTRSLRAIKSKLTEVKSQTKYLETIKETHQQAQYEAHTAIKEKTEELIAQIREQEKQLLQQVQSKLEAKMLQSGLDNLSEMRFYKTSIEQLYAEIGRVVKGTPQDCLISYEDLIARHRKLSEQALPPVPKTKANCLVKFVPCTDDLRLVLGTLQECTINDEEIEMETQTSPTSSFSEPSAATSPKPRRVTSILNALSPGRQSDFKMGKVKGTSSDRPKSPSRKINADELIAAAGRSASPTQMENAVSSVSSVSMPSTIPSTSMSSAMSSTTSIPTSMPPPQLVFKVDEIGGWPGKISSPTSMAFLPNGHIIVAECENRLQVFDPTGKSIRIIGWGKVRPQGVAVTSDGRIVITDQKEQCVKVFSSEGECITAWGNGVLRCPAAVCVLSSGNIVVTDTERHTVNIHRGDGGHVASFGAWGAGDYHFHSVQHVTVDCDDNIYVADGGASYIKVYSSSGVFLRKLSIATGGSSKQLWRPHGLTVDRRGNLLVADRDNHRITLLAPDGSFRQHVLTRADGLRYPCNVALNLNHNLLCVIENYAGFLSKDPHHAVKLFKLPPMFN